MNYPFLVKYTVAFSSFLAFPSIFFGFPGPFENLYFFLKSICAAYGVFYLFNSETSKISNDSYDALVDLHVPVSIKYKICPESSYVVKLGDIDYIFLLSPGSTYGTLVMKTEELEGIIVSYDSEKITITSGIFWCGTVKIIKL